MDLFKVGKAISNQCKLLTILYKLNEKMSTHQTRLSTGKRVSSAQDDTAGFSVAKTLKPLVRVMNRLIKISRMHSPFFQL